MMDATSTPDSLTPVKPPGSRRRRASKITLIVLTALWAVLLIPALMFAMLSPFAFDSGATPEAFQVFYMLISFPFVLLLSTAIAWILYWLRQNVIALIVASLPGIWFIYAVFVMD